jgi:hypothetical protein
MSFIILSISIDEHGNIIEVKEEVTLDALLTAIKEELKKKCRHRSDRQGRISHRNGN